PDAAKACSDGERGKPDPLRLVLVGEKGRRAEAEQRGRDGCENDPGEHFWQLPFQWEAPSGAVSFELCWESQRSRSSASMKIVRGRDALFCIRLHFVRKERIGIAQISAGQFLTMSFHARSMLRVQRNERVLQSSVSMSWLESVS